MQYGCSALVSRKPRSGSINRKSARAKKSFAAQTNMPSVTPVTLIPGTLPYADNCYPTNPQTLNADIVTRIQAFLSETFPGVYVGDSAPPADQRNRIWFNTLVTKWYQWRAPDWMRMYDEPANSKREMIWNDTPAALETYGGGSAGAVGSDTGPLWEIDHDFDGRTLVGPGVIPGSAPAITVALDDEGGAYQQTILQANLPAVDLLAAIKAGQADGFDTDNSEVLGNPSSAVNDFTLHVPLGGSGTPLVTQPPYRGRYVAKRTARIWISSPN